MSAQTLRSRARRRWREQQLPRWLRSLVFVAAMYAAAAWALSTATPYRDTVAYRHASVCPAGVNSTDCIVQTTGRIGDRRHSDTPACGPPVGCAPPTQSVRLDRDQHSEWLDVSQETYRAVQAGDLASVRTWHGTVVQMAVNGHTETYDPTSTTSLILRLAAIWLALGVALWTARSGYARRLFSSPSVGWIWLILPIAMTTEGLLLGMSGWRWIGAAALAAPGLFLLGRNVRFWTV